MAFAPPRKPLVKGVVEPRGLQNSRLPVSSPAKRSSTARSDKQDEDAHRARIIPSRYLQSRAERAKPVQAKSQSSTAISPVKARPAPKAELTKELLILRTLQTLQTCDEGEETLLQLRVRAEAELESRWLRAKEVHVRHQVSLSHERLQHDARELESLTRQDVVALETFIYRVDETRKEVDALCECIEAWAVQPTNPPLVSWHDTASELINLCDSSRLLIAPLLYKLQAMQENGVVTTVVEDFLENLNLTRQEVVLLEQYCNSVWQRTCEEVDRQYSLLHVPVEEEEPPNFLL